MEINKGDEPGAGYQQGAYVYSGKVSADEEGPAPPPPEDPFYNRVTELDAYKKRFRGKVKTLLVLNGPPNCGKSALMKHLRQQYDKEEIGPLFLYIDARKTPVRSPEDLSEALLNALAAGWLQRAIQLLRSSLPLFSAISIILGMLTISLESLLPKFIRRLNLKSTINKFEKLLTALKPLRKKPVIVIDVANNLMDWAEADAEQPELKKFLGFLVATSKQDGLAHVVLVSSNYFLATWLSQVGMAQDKFKGQVLGDLTKVEAHTFVHGDGVVGGWTGIINDPSEVDKVPAGAGDHWPAIYQQCGGNILMLQECVQAARVGGNWDKALHEVAEGPRGDVRQGFHPKLCTVRGSEPPLWTKDHWKLVLKEIINAPHHAVLVSKIEELLNTGSGRDGDEILLSMAKYNLLALRSYSDLARDLPREVYGKKREPVVTFPLQAHVSAAKDLLEDL